MGNANRAARPLSLPMPRELVKKAFSVEHFLKVRKDQTISASALNQCAFFLVDFESRPGILS